MGSSSRKKLEKKKDFQKPKLKVGKVKPKAANQTDTNFRSKAIVLNQQSIRMDAPEFSQQVLHHISLLSSRSDSQRKESLAFLTSANSAHSEANILPLPTATLLEKCCPLLLDGSLGVRQQVQKLMQVLPSEEIRDHVVKILPFVRAAITHLSSDIRKTALENLSWLLLIAGDEVVSCPGGWPKTLESCITLLGWRNFSESSQWTSSRASFRNDAKATARGMQVLEQLIVAGLNIENVAVPNMVAINFPLWDYEQHKIPTKSNAFAYLNLFGAPLEDDNRILEDREERLELFNNRFRSSVAWGIDAAKKEGGDIGRAAGQFAKTFERVMAED